MRQESVQIQQLKTRYKNSLIEKAGEINQFCLDLADDLSTKKFDFTNLNECLHKLAGSSGMYGYSDIAALARETLHGLQSREGVDQAGKLYNQLQQLRDLLEYHA